MQKIIIKLLNKTRSVRSVIHLDGIQYWCRVNQNRKLNKNIYYYIAYVRKSC